MKSRTTFLPLLVLTLVTSHAAHAAGAAPADASEMTRLNRSLASAQLVRVRSDATWSEVRGASAEASGLRVVESFAGPGHVTGPELIAWDRIQSVEAGRSKARTGALLGAAAGLAAAIAWNAADTPKSEVKFLDFGLTSQGKSMLRGLLCIGVGSATGAVVGYQVRSWNEVYGARAR